jgi:peptidyl-prolyl cis-trans isomerase A (cyclophilin A)
MKPFMLLVSYSVIAMAQAPANAAAGTALQPGLYAIVSTSMGQITAKLFEQDRPATVAHFVALATGAQRWEDPASGGLVSRPLYNNRVFDRVIPDYVIQTGDPTDSGTYDCGVRVKDEFVPELDFDRPGRLGLMNAGTSDSGGCEFFITDDEYPSLDHESGKHGYVVFGQVVSGQDVVDRISRVPCGPDGMPRKPVRLMSVTFRRVGPGSPPPAVPAVPRKSAPIARHLPQPD